jgi:tetratricopeptide (TPR) repeat protein
MGNTDAALADYEQAVELDPGYVRAYKNMLALHERLEDWEAMANDYERLAALEPYNRSTYLFLQAEILRQSGLTNAAFRAYSRVLADEPEHVDALYERALLYYASGQTESAMADLDRALSISPQAANIHYARGLLFHAKENYSAAIDSFTRALALRPAYSDALLARAATFRAAGDREGAIADMERLEYLELDEELQTAANVLRTQLDMPARTP